MNIPLDVRAAAKLLRRLALRNSCLRVDSTGAGRLHSAGTDTRRQASPAVDPALVRSLLSEGLIAAGGEERSLVLSEAGRAFLRRWLAGAGADAFAAQHQDRAAAFIDAGELGRRRVTVNRDESPLSALRRRKGKDGRPLIDAIELAAGERLRADYTRGQIMPRVTANWTAAIASGRRDGGSGGLAALTEAAIAARRRVDRALSAVGPDLAGVLIDFCCFLKGLEEIERERQWPVRSAKLVLRLALASLARHYGIAATAQGPARSARMLHWGAADYRPTIE